MSNIIKTLKKEMEEFYSMRMPVVESRKKRTSEKEDINCKNCAHPLDVEKPKCECCGSINVWYKSAQPKAKDIYAVNAENHLKLELSAYSMGYQSGLPSMPRYEMPEEAKQKLEILKNHKTELLHAITKKPNRPPSFGEKLRNSKTLHFLAELIFPILFYRK